MRGEADRPDVRSEQEQGQVPDTPHQTKDDARGQGAPVSLQMGQGKPTPSDLLAPRTAREDVETEHDHDYGDCHGDSRSVASEQDAQADGAEPKS